MTIQWYFFVGDEELGPVSFRELVELVRVGVITEEGLVRSSGKETTQRADSVIGLFYMSRQNPVEQFQSDESRSSVIDRLATIEVSNHLHTAERPEWLQRLLQLTTTLQTGITFGRATSIDEESDSTQYGDQPFPDTKHHPVIIESETESYGQPLTTDSGSNLIDGKQDSSVEPFMSSPWSETMDAALSQVDSRRSIVVGRKNRVWKECERIAALWMQVCGSRRFLSHGFRIGCMIGIASLVGIQIEQWSIRESMRFPMRKVQQNEGTRVFPGIGKCSSTEYMLLIVNAMLTSGAGAYGIAVFLESRTEE